MRCVGFAVLALLTWPVLAAGAFEPWTGGATPALVLKDLSGRTHQLSDYRGKAVVINFWATWCEPCRDEIPSMQQLEDRLAGRPFALLAVNMGEPASRIAGFLDKMPIDYSVLLDPEMRAAKAWQVRFLPYSFVLDRAHRIRYRVIGEIDWNAPDVVRRIEALMQDNL